ncbi:MAG: type II toxin-antitoxin system VapC family toxin [Terriglobia bacterium]
MDSNWQGCQPEGATLPDDYHSSESAKTAGQRSGNPLSPRADLRRAALANDPAGSGRTLTLYFLESSALAKLFVQEKGSDELITLVEPLSQPQKVVSTLAGVEVHSAIRRRERAGELAPAHAAEALVILAAELARMTEQPVNPLVIDAARQMLDNHPLRALDAIQLASCWAVRAVSGINDLVFATSDKALLQAAAAEGFQVLDPASRGHFTPS